MLTFQYFFSFSTLLFLCACVDTMHSVLGMMLLSCCMRLYLLNYAESVDRKSLMGQVKGDQDKEQKLWLRYPMHLICLLRRPVWYGNMFTYYLLYFSLLFYSKWNSYQKQILLIRGFRIMIKHSTRIAYCIPSFFLFLVVNGMVGFW